MTTQPAAELAAERALREKIWACAAIDDLNGVRQWLAADQPQPEGDR